MERFRWLNDNEPGRIYHRTTPSPTQYDEGWPEKHPAWRANTTLKTALATLVRTSLLGLVLGLGLAKYLPAWADEEAPSIVRSERVPLRMLVAVDDSRQSMAACWSAAALARKVGATLTLVHVAQPHLRLSSFDSPQKWRDAQEAARVVGEKLLDEARAACGADVSCTTEVLFGDPAPAICRRARELDTDLIVVGSRRLGTIDRVLLGSVSSVISQQAPCSVLIIRERVP